MSSVASTTLVIAGFLVLISLVQPAAERLRLPYTVLLAFVGVSVGTLSSFLLYTPLTTLFDDIVAPIVNLPISASIFPIVFLERVRLGSGEFVGEMALLGRRRRRADVVSLGYGLALELAAADFQRFLSNYPRAKAEIERTAKARTPAGERLDA